ncbi:long-chain fatty acid--CoA ligase [Novosphingobium flavum]|uniref:Long-chain fatty acid--CoA ligase n=1 Tax=Novosphingobium flavum TaxID=1778672 RepID=A0A7X1KKG1_9SPHN|nr:long-chain fatty acid--CoA ligase [Novosphingobium flavum]MBC2664511.1 long-chain fatty acid--CoA ligase [Novosphingobium flavum]
MDVNKAPEPWRTGYAHPCAWEQDYEPLTLPELFARAARDHASHPLVEFFGRTYSYAALHAEAKAFAAGLQQWGIRPGDRVGLYLPNVPIYVPAYYGAMLAGATVVNFSPLYTVEELEAQVADSGTRLLVTVDLAKLLPHALAVLDGSALEGLVVGRFTAMLPRFKGFAFRLVNGAQLTPVPRRADMHEWAAMLHPAEPDPVALDPRESLALLQYTGGTTGTPKGAMLSHFNLTANARQIEAIDPHQSERDVILGALPLFHVFANACVLNRTVVDGGCIAMLPRFDTGQVLAAIRRTRPTSFPGVPTMFQALLDDPRLEGTDMSSLRVCISGGAPLPGAVKERFEAITGVRLCEGYGLTECSGVASANAYEGADRPGTIGQPLPATRLAMVDKEDPSRLATPGEPGELVIAGPQIMRGYWNRPEADASAFTTLSGERWLRTGDVAVLEEDGFVRIVDRMKDMIAVGGFKVFPSQVEAVLLQHPAVKEALVIGMPDAYRGEVPRAFVTLRPDQPASAADLRDWLNDRVGKHERCDAVVIRETMPKTMIGKLDRKALRAEAQAELQPA